MDAMRRRPPYLLKETNRHGRTVWYVRKGDGPRVRIRGDYGSAEFVEAYEAAVNGKARPQQAAASAGSLEWLIARYRETGAWQSLSASTRKGRERIFLQTIEAAGTLPYASLTRAVIVAGREKRAATPAQARTFLDALRGLFRWALDAGLVSVDPTAGVKNPSRPKSGGFPVWTEDDVARYQKRWPIGMRQRIWLDVLLYTGLRRGDAVRLGRQHVRDGVAEIRTEKSGFMTEVTIPILPILEATLAAGPCGDLAFICGERGAPLTKEAFGNMFRKACLAAKVDKSAHGVRKIGATRAANAGATVAELEALFGWHGGGMASLYTRSADRRRLATGAISKLERNAG
ncbi:tyrosine-type recombinase/integrase [Aurantimonas coralicida]|uniref:tyrosine-type recombinase/integrase n=1 Tax=Aurantimonas coralicida TaxID=182270 RepID=UPI001D1871A6|nr:tyrosine-type recombinase/integrase [Aurantimonas coralicida]MCC4299486.1 tyrosine-type recombinase/integrase [Aurantimonas coralicida]